MPARIKRHFVKILWFGWSGSKASRTYWFENLADMDFFVKGATEASGWTEYRVLEDGLFEFLAERGINEEDVNVKEPWGYSSFKALEVPILWGSKVLGFRRYGFRTEMEADQFMRGVKASVDHEEFVVSDSSDRKLVGYRVS